MFLAKDHHFNSTQFAEVKEGDKINVRVIGQRFELNDKYISIIAELVKEKEVLIGAFQKEKKPKIVIKAEYSCFLIVSR